jgi:hypothetical protein
MARQAISASSGRKVEALPPELIERSSVIIPTASHGKAVRKKSGRGIVEWQIKINPSN